MRRLVSGAVRRKAEARLAAAAHHIPHQGLPVYRQGEGPPDPGLFQWIEHATNAPAEQSIVSVLRHSSDIPLITVICFSAAIAAPLVEELIFRGYLYPIMKKYTGVWFALITTYLLFGIILVSLVPFIPLAIFGAVLVLLYEYTGSIWTPIIAHCIFNTATLINILYPGILLPYGT